MRFQKLLDELMRKADKENCTLEEYAQGLKDVADALLETATNTAEAEGVMLE